MSAEDWEMLMYLVLGIAQAWAFVTGIYTVQ